jgi:hypothetical protein
MGRSFQTVLTMEQNTPSRRPHYHRGRRGHDRRGSERRTPPPQPQQESAGGRDHRDHVDVEQIMREIRARIAKGSGIDLTNQQIQELAARRLEAILDPRAVKPALLDQLRRGAAAADLPPTRPATNLEFQESSLYDSPNGFIRFMRRLLRPLLALFVNHTPLAEALAAQAAINKETAERESSLERRQAEWNALQFELLQKMVTETARVSIEMQSLALRVESLAAKVDFNDRRVRAIEATAHQSRPSGRSSYEVMAQAPAPRGPAPVEATVSSATGSPDAPAAATAGSAGDLAADGLRKRRRRRRGRRSGAGQGVTAFAAVTGEAAAATDLDAGDRGDADVDGDETGDDEPAADEAPSVETAVAAPEPVISTLPEPVVVQPPEPVVQPEAFHPPEQPTPPRDEAAPMPDVSPAVEPPDSGPSDR